MLLIGENINASNKKVGEAIAGGDLQFIADLAGKQSEAGVDYLDINVGSAQGAWQSPEAAMEWLVDVVTSVTDKPLAIDSDSPAVIAAALRRYRGGKVIINSVTAEPSRLRSIGALAAERNAMVVALAMGEGSIPKKTDERLAACSSIMSDLRQMGISEERVIFDPLVLPVSVDTGQAMVTLQTIRAIKSSFPRARTVLGLSNISFGLPNRSLVNRAFLLMAAAAGLDAAILNPLDTRTMSFIALANLLTGNDAACRAYIRAHRKGLLTA
ncbi:MAG: methyltetrahydrofolate cobalamin methyltransferase [Chloroflexi bacterium]|nr:methyltetrahydrofolate cobalamin methyltransferase [Chloroflexota bacterium]